MNRQDLINISSNQELIEKMEFGEVSNLLILFSVASISNKDVILNLLNDSSIIKQSKPIIEFNENDMQKYFYMFGFNSDLEKISETIYLLIGMYGECSFIDINVFKVLEKLIVINGDSFIIDNSIEKYKMYKKLVNGEIIETDISELPDSNLEQNGGMKIIFVIFLLIGICSFVSAFSFSKTFHLPKLNIAETDQKAEMDARYKEIKAITKEANTKRYMADLPLQVAESIATHSEIHPDKIIPSATSFLSTIQPIEKLNAPADIKSGLNICKSLVGTYSYAHNLHIPTELSLETVADNLFNAENCILQGSDVLNQIAEKLDAKYKKIKPTDLEIVDKSKTLSDVRSGFKFVNKVFSFGKHLYGFVSHDNKNDFLKIGHDFADLQHIHSFGDFIHYLQVEQLQHLPIEQIQNLHFNGGKYKIKSKKHKKTKKYKKTKKHKKRKNTKKHKKI
jgi:hypothetical protein